MASLKAKEIPIPSPLTIFSLVQLYMLFFLIPSVKTTSFNYPSFGSNLHNITLQGNASTTPKGIELTRNEINGDITYSTGRALYADPVRLWDSTTGQVADFITHFSFVIEQSPQTTEVGADGIVFFLAPNGSEIPPSSFGAFLGVMSDPSVYEASMEMAVVAVEFDTFPNAWDPPKDHIGIDINSIMSAVTFMVDLRVNDTANVWVSYNSSSKNLSVYLTHEEDPQFHGESLISYVVDLKRILPEWINVGFSATTGRLFELHTLRSWEFNSTEFLVMETEAPLPAPPTDPTGTGIGGRGKRKINLGLVIGLLVSILFTTAVIGLIFFVLRKKRNGEKDDTIKEMSSDGDYESGAGGPRRFAYGELVRATNNFTNGGKLGEGGFGGVYKGILSDTNVEVAVKKISKGSRQGKKEYISEVKIISQLRHRNLVQLLGWCHELSELLLVYEYMPNGSLDFHLFGGRTILTWLVRYKIALGLASALLYLHEEWEQCVVHRDIKSSNIMLDSSFNAKLGDFGLARFVDHDVGVKTTILAGTMGYMAPECHAIGKAGKESDVYSFGVVALEIVSGRRVVEPEEEASKVGLISWVWGLYGSGKLLEAADSKLDMDFNEQQIERLLIVGLWCANLDYNIRPSIKQAIAVLNFDAPLPYLPLKMSLPTHIISSLHDLGLSYPSSSSGAENQGNQSQVSYGSHSTNSTNLSSSSSLLHQESQ